MDYKKKYLSIKKKYFKTKIDHQYGGNKYWIATYEDKIYFSEDPEKVYLCKKPKKKFDPEKYKILDLSEKEIIDISVEKEDNIFENINEIKDNKKKLWDSAKEKYKCTMKIEQTLEKIYEEETTFNTEVLLKKKKKKNNKILKKIEDIKKELKGNALKYFETWLKYHIKDQFEWVETEFSFEDVLTAARHRLSNKSLIKIIQNKEKKKEEKKLAEYMNNYFHRTVYNLGSSLSITTSGEAKANVDKLQNELNKKSKNI